MKVQELAARLKDEQRALREEMRDKELAEKPRCRCFNPGGSRLPLGSRVRLKVGFQISSRQAELQHAGQKYQSFLRARRRGQALSRFP